MKFLEIEKDQNPNKNMGNKHKHTDYGKNANGT